jgi:serine/threonine protein kinase
MIGVCNALNDIHASNLAHRDLKPQNILLDDNRNSAILTDFGSMSVIYMQRCTIKDHLIML